MADATSSATMMSCVLAPLLFASVAVAQNAAAPVAPAATAPAATGPSTAEKTAAAPPKISFAGGQLKIEASDSTLRDVLSTVSSLTGVKIDIPAGASSDSLPVLKLGPGPARQVLASLLSRSNFDYVIMASDSDPEGIQKVVLMPRDKRGSGGNAEDVAARPSLSSYARVVSPPRADETPEPGNPAPPPDNTTAQASAATPAPAALDQPTPPGPSTGSQSALSPAALSNRSGLTTEGALSPPGSMDPQSINQQLLQMYQQRTQMTQQGRQPVQPPTPSNPSSQ